MPSAEIIALTDEIQARMEQGEFDGLGPIAVEGGMFLPDAEVAAPIRAADRERQARLDGMIFAARQRADRMCDRLEQSCGGAEASAADWALCEEMRAALDASMQDLLDLRRLVGDAPSSDGVWLQGEASGRTPEA